MSTFQRFSLFVVVISLAISGNVFAKKKEIKGFGVTAFPENPSAENLAIKTYAKSAKVKKLDTICIGTFATSFVQQSVVQIRARTLLGDGKLRKAAGRRLVNVEKATRQAITDETYAYARKALTDAKFTVKPDAECMALKKWDGLKVSDKSDGELAKLGIFSEGMKAPTGATHAARHGVTGRPDYKSFGISPFGDLTNNGVKSIKLAKKQQIGLVDFSFALDFNVNSASASVNVSSDTIGNTTYTTTSKEWDFDFTDALFVAASGANYVNSKFKTAIWSSGPQAGANFPAILDNSYITGFEENGEVWDKRINAVNFDIKIDQDKYKEIYVKTIKAYIDVYVANMAALKPL